MMHKFVVITAKGLTELLAEELTNFGLQPKQSGQVVYLEGRLVDAYRVCMFSRIASRVLMVLDTFEAHDEDGLYNGVYRIDWSQHFSVEQSFAVDFNERGSVLKNTQFGAVKVKDAIVDQFSECFDARPSVDVDKPDVRLSVLWQKQTVTVHLDLSGGSLAHRGYRLSKNTAPLRENLAAGLLMRVRWMDIAAQNKTLLDPMCGSGTLVIEAAMMAADIAPQIHREYFGFVAWKGHDVEAWNALISEAKQRAQQGLMNCTLKLTGLDVSLQAIEAAKKNAARAGVDELVLFKHQALERLTSPRGAVGLVITNPPYGERLGEENKLVPLYQMLGEKLIAHFDGVQAAVLTSSETLAYALGLRANKVHDFYNGALVVKLYRIDISDKNTLKSLRIGAKTAAQFMGFDATQIAGLESFQNRIKKNKKHFGRWAMRNKIYAYRLYDADIPEFALAIDMYTDTQGEHWAVVQEYAAPKTIDKRTAAGRLYGAMAVLPALLDIEPNHIVLKRRERQRDGAQYQQQDAQNSTLWVQEGQAVFEVNLFDYLDTGLFLDHRPMRRKLFEISQNKRLLNLFSYTSTASVQAALGGAEESLSVDLSKTYLAWSRRNFEKNGLDITRHQLYHADCIEWLAEVKPTYQGTFDVIYIDPPTLSRSKRMQGQFDVQSAHHGLLEQATNLLNQEGVIYFSNNYKKFKFDYDNQEIFIKEVSKQFLDEDFKRNAKIHRVWELKR